MKANLLSLWVALTLLFSQTAKAQNEPPATAPPDTAVARQRMLEAANSVKANQRQQAIAQLEEAKSRIRRAIGTENELYSDALIQQSRVWGSLGRWDSTLAVSKEARRISASVLGAEHLKTAVACNNTGIASFYLGLLDSAVFYHTTALSIRQKKLPPKHPDIATSMENLGLVLWRKSQHNRAEPLLQAALQIRRDTLGEEHRDVANSIFNLGNLYLSMHRFQAADDAYQRALAMRLRLLGERHPETAASYANLAHLKDWHGDYELAIQYQREALRIYRLLYGEKHPSIAGVLGSLGGLYAKAGSQDTALALFAQAEKMLLEYHRPDHFSLGDLYGRWARCHMDMGHHAQALGLLRQSMDIHRANSGEWSSDVALDYAETGTCLFEMRRWEEAAEAFGKSLAVRKKVYGENDPLTAFSEASLATALAALGRFDTADSLFQTAKQKSGYVKEGAFETVANPMILLFTLRREAQMNHAKAQATGQAEPLRRAHNLYQSAINCQQYADRRIYSTGSREAVAEYGHDNFHGPAIANALDLSRKTSNRQCLRDAFRWSEFSKSQVLRSTIRQLGASRFADVPDSLLRQEAELRADLGYWEEQRSERVKTFPVQHDTVLAADSKVLRAKLLLDRLLNRFTRQYPRYSRARYEHPNLSVEAVQAMLRATAPDQSLLHYLVGDSSVFIFLIQPDTFDLFHVRNTANLDSLIAQMRDGITGYRQNQRPDLVPDSRQRHFDARYTDSAHRLWEKLVQPVEARLTQRVVIVPDGPLGFLPFEALLRKRPATPADFASHDYLLRHRDISYCYSADLLQEMQAAQYSHQSSACRFLLLAPFFSPDGQRAILKNSPDLLGNTRTEVASILRFWSGDTLLDRRATLPVFLQKAAKYCVLHLSTHGAADKNTGDHSYLEFRSDGSDTLAAVRLYVRDLYALSLRAELVTLSACETSLGQLRRGEGIVSLARAFAYAGAKAICSTLWKVKDRDTPELTARFYTNLKKGQPKDAALAEAKRALLATGKSGLSHPYAWASMIAIGDMQPLERK